MKVFDNLYLSEAVGYAKQQTSMAIPVESETVVMSATNINAGGTEASLELTLEGSYDGQVWKTTSLVLTCEDSPTRFESIPLQVDFAYVRIAAVLSSTENDGKVLFDAELVFSHQDN